MLDFLKRNKPTANKEAASGDPGQAPLPRIQLDIDINEARIIGLGLRELPAKLSFELLNKIGSQIQSALVVGPRETPDASTKAE
jgi:hypothetical protein